MTFLRVGYMYTAVMSILHDTYFIFLSNVRAGDFSDSSDIVLLSSYLAPFSQNTVEQEELIIKCHTTGFGNPLNNIKHNIQIEVAD